MYLNEENAQYFLVVTAKNNGDAYRDSKNVKRALREAKAALMASFSEQLNDLMSKAETELYNDWYEDEIKEAQRQEWEMKRQELKEGKTVEITEAQYDEYLNCLPPAKMFYNGFYMGEPYSHTSTGRPIHLKCWKESKKYYAKYEAI